MSDSSSQLKKRTRINPDWHGFLSLFIRVYLCHIYRGEMGKLAQVEPWRNGSQRIPSFLHDGVADLSGV